MSEKDGIVVRSGRSGALVNAAADPMAALNIGGAADDLKVSLSPYKIEYCAGDCPKEYKKGKLTPYDGAERLPAAEQMDSVEVVWLSMSKARLLWPKYDPKQPREEIEPLCKSANGVNPDGGSAMMDVSSCEACPHSKWDNDTKTPPACAEVYRLLCYDLKNERPFVFDIKRTGIKPLRRFINLLRRKKNEYLYSGLLVNCCVKVKISAEEEGNYYSPHLEIVERLDEEAASKFSELSVALMDQFSQMEPEKHSTAAGDDEVEF